MFDWVFTFEGWIGLATLTALEIILGIDNLVVLSIISGKLPYERRPLAQKLGLVGALILRISMLFMLVWLTKLKASIINIGGFDLSWRDVILLLGGMFLLWKATVEIRQEVSGGTEGPKSAITSSFVGVILMITVVDFVFALDSIITAVAMTDVLPIMIGANILAIGMMMMSARAISDFIDEHPTIKMLALAFILLVGVMLVADGFHYHIPRAYIYFAIVFSLAVEMLNFLVRRQAEKNE